MTYWARPRRDRNQRTSHPGVFDITDEDVLTAHADFTETGSDGSDGSEQRLLGVLASASLSKNLDHYDIAGTLEAQSCILGEDLSLRVLGTDVKVVRSGMPYSRRIASWMPWLRLRS